MFLITAWNSSGYFHGDEHYQILEFARWKLGLTLAESLPWEFNEQIRPTLHPSLAYIFLKAAFWLNIENPYTQTFLLRLFTGCFALFSILFFWKESKGQFESRQLQILYLALFFLLWFMPFLSVRFSSETLGGLWLLIGLGFFYDDKRRARFLFMGLCFGLSFLFRYQMALAILGFGLWLLLIQKTPFRQLVTMTFGFLAVCGIGFLVDSWFYNELVFTPWNYFYETILNTESPSFGSAPMHYYLFSIFSYSGFWVGFPFLVFLFWLLIKKPKTMVLWPIFFFILGHSLVPHKEIRFLFPIAFLLPLFFMQGLRGFKESYPLKRLEKPLLAYAYFFLGLNLLGLVAMGFKPASIGRMEITEMIHESQTSERIHLIYGEDANPYDPWGGLYAHHYLPEGIQETEIKSLCDLDDSKLMPSAQNFLVVTKHQLNNPECIEVLEGMKTEKLGQSMPAWIERVNIWFSNGRLLVLYKLEPTQGLKIF